MALQTRSFGQFLQDMAAAAQARASAILDFTVGSVALALFEAVAGVAIWLQARALDILALTRAATSTGTDLDTFFADFGFTRSRGFTSSGTVNFARFTGGAAATIPLGTLVQTSDGKLAYSVVADNTNTYYSPSQMVYIIPPSVLTIGVPVQATVSGLAGNVAAGLVNTLAQAIPYVDTVSNPAPMSGGADPQTDEQARAAFQAFIASLSQGTRAAVARAITQADPVLTYALVENYDVSGVFDPGYFYAVIDDGSGATPAPIVSAVAAAIDAVRALGTRFGVFAASRISVTVALSIHVDTAFNATSVQAAVQQALMNYVNALPVATVLQYNQIVRVAFQASSGVLSVSGVTVNGATADITPTGLQVVKASTVTVTLV